MSAIAMVGVQSRQLYITSNNRLRQSVGASKLIDDAIKNAPEEGGTKLYVGGGNAVIEFSSRHDAKKALETWSRKWVREAPGLRLVGGIGEDENPKLAHENARRAMFDDEEKGSFGDELGILPVTRYCRDTGLAAGKFDIRSRSWKSAEACAKERKAEKYENELYTYPAGDPKLRKYQETILKKEHRFPLDLDNLGMRSASRHIAVVHCDGNGLGRFIKGQIADMPRERFAASVADLSKRITDAAFEAWLATLTQIRASMSEWYGEHGFLERKDTGTAEQFFPVRPLVDSGDDVTWICPARIGLGSAVRYCQHWEKQSEQKLQKRLTACAGVAIVPAGFPFRRAYEIAEDLCRNAKNYRKEQSHEESFIDFHLTMEGAGGDIASIRRATYRKGLEPKPLSIDGDWERFNKMWLFFTEHENWSQGRGRAKKLLEDIAKNTQMAKDTERLFQQQGYPLPQASNVDDCFRPLEFLDFHAKWEVSA